MTDVAELTLAERVAALEAIVAPRATVPPITVGALTNVPVPGSQLAAQWAADASGMVVHRFATTAALKAWTPAAGVFAVAVDTGVLWRRAAGGWTQQTPWIGAAFGTSDTPVDTNPITLATVNIPADPAPRSAVITANVRVDISGGGAGGSRIATLDLSCAGTSVGVGNADGRGDLSTGVAIHHICVTCTVATLPTGVVVPVVMKLLAGVGFTISTINDFRMNRLDVTVFPKGA